MTDQEPVQKTEEAENIGGLAWFWAQLSERRVLSAIAIYLGIAWGMIEAGQFFIDYLQLDPGTLRTLVVTAVFGLPTTVVLAWYHGAPGSQYVTTREIILMSGLVAIWLVVLILPPETPTSKVTDQSDLSTPASNLSTSTVAVLYMQNLSTNSKLNWLSAGFADAVSTALTKVSKLNVLSRNRVAPYRSSRPVDPTVIAQELGCGRLVIGSYQVAGDDLRISCQIVEGHNGKALSAFKTDGKLSELFKLQDELASKIVGHFTGRKETNSTKRVADFAAYRNYCEALTAMDEGRMHEAAVGLRDALEGGMVYSPALDELLRLNVDTTHIQEDGRQIEESLSRIRNDSKEYWTTYATRGTMNLISVRSADGTSLPFRLAEIDSAGNRDYYIDLKKRLNPGETLLLWSQLELFLSCVDTGVGRRYFTPESISYNGPPRRAIQTTVLPAGYEPLSISPEPKSVFLRDGKWHLVFARRLGQDVYLEIDFFYSNDKKVLQRANEALEYSPTLLYAKEQLNERGVKVLSWTRSDTPLIFGDLVLSYDATKLTTPGDFWAFYKKDDSKPRPTLIVRGKERLKLELAPKFIPDTLMANDASFFNNSSLSRILLTRARLAYSSGHFKKAQNILSRLLSTEQKDTERALTLARMAECLFAQNKAEEAKSFCRRAVITLEKAKKNSLAEIPETFFDRPISELNEFLRKKPDDFLAVYGLALQHYRAGSYHDAQRAIRRALSLEPSARWNHRLAARISLALESHKKACSHIASFMESTDYEHLVILAQFLLGKDDKSHAVGVKLMCRHLETYKRRATNPFFAALRLCANKNDINGFYKAIKAFTRGKSDGKWLVNRYVYNYLANWQKSKDPEYLNMAVQFARFNAQRFSKDVNIQDSLGELLFYAKEYDECSSVFEKILTHDKSWQRANLFIGQCLAARGDSDKARSYYELAIHSKNKETKKEAERLLNALPKQK